MLPIRSNRRVVRFIIALVATVVAGIAACTSRIGDGISDPKPAVAIRSASVNPAQPYFEFQVTKEAQQIPGTGTLHYPDALRSAHVNGEVLVQFVVDSSGKVELESFRVLKSNHELFTQAVKTFLSSMRFSPAQVQGKRVKQLVQWPFVFAIPASDSSAPSAGSTDQPHFEFQVEKQVRQIPGTGTLRYPDALRAANG